MVTPFFQSNGSTAPFCVLFLGHTCVLCSYYAHRHSLTSLSPSASLVPSKIDSWCFSGIFLQPQGPLEERNNPVFVALVSPFLSYPPWSVFLSFFRVRPSLFFPSSYTGPMELNAAGCDHSLFLGPRQPPGTGRDAFSFIVFNVNLGLVLPPTFRPTQWTTGSLLVSVFPPKDCDATRSLLDLVASSSPPIP